MTDDIQQLGAQTTRTKDMNDISQRLASKIAARDALNDEIALIEQGIRKAAYDSSMSAQLISVNESRLRDGKRQMSMSEFLSGVFDDR